MIICVLGPTGVGKTRLSEFLAKKLDAIIINADSMQVYKELNIGTAKIKPEEMENVPHYLFDIKNPDDDFSVYEYQKLARQIIDENQNKNIILVGGTGLYVKATLFEYEFSKIKKCDYENYSNEELYNMLAEKNLLEEVHINNRRRMISKLNSNGNSNKKDILKYKDVIMIGLTTPRDNLYNNINKRVDQMIEDGLIQEVERLYKKYGNVKSLQTGIGYKEIIDYLNETVSLPEAVEKIKSRSRNYAKRQYTWFLNQMNLKWFETNYKDFSKTTAEVLKYLKENIK